jgi:hypothetical protein
MSLDMPCAAGTVINQGSRVKLVSNLLVPTAICTDDFVGMADFQNPDALGYAVTSGKVLLKDNVVNFDAPSANDTFNFGDDVYAYDDAVPNHYPGAVTKDTTLTPKKVGSYVGASGVVGGAGVKVPVKLLPTVVI